MSELLITTSTFPLSEHGPGLRFMFELAQSLTAHFDRVHVLAPGYPDMPKREQWGKVSVHRFNYFWPHAWQRLCYGYGVVQNVRRSPWLLFAIPFFILFQYLTILRLCKHHPIELVNSHWLIFQGLTGAMARQRGKYRHVVHVHAAGLYVLLRLPRWIGRTVARYIFHRSDHVICESTYVREKLDELLGFTSCASISCMGVDVEKFAPVRLAHDEQPGHIVFIGRFVEKKGVEYLLRAMPLVREQEPHAFLTLIGSGFLDKELRQLAEELNLIAPIVDFKGFQPHHVIAELLRTARVVTVPSIVDSSGETEGMPTVILEALAAGKRVVASCVNGTPDIIRHLENGWLCEPKQPEALAQALVNALDYDGTEILQAAIETASEYDWSRLAVRYVDYLSVSQEDLKIS